MATRLFAKGQSGNPSGRPKEHREIERMARTYAPEAIERLVTIMRGKSHKLALKASEVLLDRGFGRPAQAITGEGGEGPVRIVVKWPEPEPSPLIIDVVANSSISTIEANATPFSSVIDAQVKLLPASTTS